MLFAGLVRRYDECVPVCGPRGRARNNIGLSDNLYMLHSGRISYVGCSHLPKSLVVSYLVKIALLGLVLMFVPFPENLRHGWTLAGACTGVILWIVIETVSIARLRILYFDTDSEDHSR